MTAGEAPHWVQPGNGSEPYKFKADCGPCPSTCEICPDMGDTCEKAEVVSRSEFDGFPTATVDFSCGLVFELEGYSSYIYPTLVDSSNHTATGLDASLNIVGRTAHVFFVANPCVGTLPWSAGSSSVLRCTILDVMQRTHRDIVRSAILFD